MQPEILNGQITDTKLGFQDHGIFTCQIAVTYGDGGVQHVPALRLEKGAGTYLIQLLNVFGVQSYEDIKGQYCRVELVNGVIAKLGHITRNVWLDIETVLLSKA